MSDELCLRGSLSDYAKWRKITLAAAVNKNKRGQIVMCKQYPTLVDFLGTELIARGPGRPRKSDADRFYRVQWRMDEIEWTELAPLHRKHIERRKRTK